MSTTKDQEQRAKSFAQSGEIDEAIAAYRELAASSTEPAKYDGALAGLLLAQGRRLQGAGKNGYALEAYIESASLSPGKVDALNSAARLCLAAGNPKRAESLFQQAVENRPDSGDLLVNLGAAYQAQNKVREAENSYLKAIELAPDNSAAWNNLASVYYSSGRIEDSLAAYDSAKSADPGSVAVASNWLLTLNYSESASPDQIRSAHEDWARRFGQAATAVSPAHDPDPDPERTLKIGYVSADFRLHSVAYFFLPVLAHHDREAVHVTCYNNSQRRDEMTRVLQRGAHEWRDVAHLSDQDLCEQIRSDKIDILVDLGGHTSGSRLRAFAQKPAPIQVTWLGYPATTGIAAIDYKISDDVADPPSANAHYVEHVVRIEGGFHVFQAPANSPAINELPALTSGRLTFGSFNNAAKISDATIDAWAGVLKVCPESVLVIKSKGLSDPGMSAVFADKFKQRGIEVDRVVFKDWFPGVLDHLIAYGDIDIALDTFPYNGTTTTCESLWMGVPVVSLCGERQASRTGASIMASAGIEGWVASSSEEFVEIARRWSTQLEELAEIRSSLRDRMRASPLCQGRRLSAGLENAYREMWRAWLDDR